MRQLIALASIAVLVIAGCGGGGSSSDISGTGPTGPANNVAAMTVDSGPTGNSVNTPFVSVTVCEPSSPSTCQTIDHIEVDTASYGLRIISSVLQASITLPAVTDATGDATYECAVFGDGYSWGSVREANVQLAGELASNIPIQIIGDAVSGTPPASCSAMGTTNENTVALFGANGIIGVGPFAADDGAYYSCPGNSCGEITPLAEVSNPVASFTTDNNGVIVELPAVSATGATSLAGSLVFGIGTESNNGLGTATIYTLDPDTGTLSITYNSNTYPGSIIDSGSNAIYLIDNSIPTCSGFYCPASTLSLTAMVTGANDTSNTVGFSIANAETLFANNSTGVAFDNLGAPNTFGNFIDLGLPFFFGAHVYTAISDAETPGGFGPYVAF
jgi:hypothetical protein